jgi:hypothetical protein
MKRRTHLTLLGAVPIGCLLTALGGSAAASQRGPDPWESPVNLETIAGTSADLNTGALEGCPIESPDGLSLYLASNRPGGLGGIDIWLATRSDSDAAFGAPVNLGAPVNSAADDFCPSPSDGGWLFFVSSRAPGCGSADLYVTRPLEDDSDAWGEPLHLGCHVNSPGTEMSPSLVGDPEGGSARLYFSSDRAGGYAPDGATPDHDLYQSELSPFGFGPPQLVEGLNTEFNDLRPNLAADGLEIVFDSNRPGGLGGTDVWSATRGSPDEPWTTAANVTEVNSAANEARASLSGDGARLYLGSNRPGSEPAADGQPSSDVYVAHRNRGWSTSR